MKKSFLSIVFISLIIGACTTQKLASSYSNDDVYSASSGATYTPQKHSTPPVSGAQVITTPDSATGVKAGSSTFADDYNDYSYSSRINRFNNNDTTKGYFDETYTGNTTYSGSGSSDPNVNFSLGFGFGNYWGPSMSFGMGWGYPYSNWGYPYYGWGYDWGWGYPYYGWYNPWYYSPYYYPYGCCYCPYPWYNENYPPYATTGSYYGSRRTLTSNDQGTTIRNDRVSTIPTGGTATINDRVTGSPANPRITGTTSRGQVAIQPSTRTTPSNQETYRYSRSGTARQAAYSRNNGQQAQTSRQQPTPRYSRPGNNTAVQRTGSAQSYSSPVYRQAKSSQEYISPRTQNTGTSRTSPSTVTSRNNNTNPASSGYRSRSVPSSTGTKSYSTPSRSYSPGYSTPARSNSNYSAPARSSGSGSYSAPSSGSSGSYSAPVRSGGSGGSSPSGGSGGGRRR
ncbi:MAG: hypothetical protein M0P58_06845 [Bacteroidales bacterium]|nr:hypothetical protein [Bacteroidales bacterium]